jgi:hypothetical protein
MNMNWRWSSVRKKMIIKFNVRRFIASNRCRLYTHATSTKWKIIILHSFDYPSSFEALFFCCIIIRCFVVDSQCWRRCMMCFESYISRTIHCHRQSQYCVHSNGSRYRREMRFFFQCIINFCVHMTLL